MTPLWSDRDRDLAIGLLTVVSIFCLLAASHVAAYQYGASTNAPLCEGDSLNPSGITVAPRYVPKGRVR